VCTGLTFELSVLVGVGVSIGVIIVSIVVLVIVAIPTVTWLRSIVESSILDRRGVIADRLASLTASLPLGSTHAQVPRIEESQDILDYVTLLTGLCDERGNEGVRPRYIESSIQQQKTRRDETATYTSNTTSSHPLDQIAEIVVVVQLCERCTLLDVWQICA